jgi:hypothetical protein
LHRTRPAPADDADVISLTASGQGSRPTLTTADLSRSAVINPPEETKVLRKLIVVTALGAAAATAFAVNLADVQQTLPLKDGSTVYIFKDGKMSMEDKLGRVTRMQPGHVMETKDGQKIIMIGDEVSRLEVIANQGRGGRN